MMLATSRPPGGSPRPRCAVKERRCALRSEAAISMTTTADGWALEPNNEFAVFESVAEILAYCFASEGPEFVDRLLDAVETDKPTLQKAADESRALGLTELAAYLGKGARKAPVPVKEVPSYVRTE